MWTNFKSRIAFVCFVAAIVIAGSLAIVAIAQYNGLIHQASDGALSTAQNVQKYFLMQRARQLENASNIVASNPSFAGYVARAFGDGSPLGGVDAASLRDLIGERREDLNADVVAILDVTGKVIAAVGQGQLDALSLTRNPILERAKKTDDSVSGFLVQGKRLLLVTCTSVRRGADIQAMLLTGQRIDANVIAEASRLANAGLALVQQSGTTWEVVTSNVDDQVSQQIPAALQLLFAIPKNETGEHSESLAIGNGIWMFRAAPLFGSDGNVQLVSLLPPTFRDNIVRAIGLPLLYVGGALLALLLLIGILTWLRLGLPLDHLAQLSVRAEKGDHALEFNMKAHGVVGRIGGGFNHLTRELSRYRVPTGTPTRRATDRQAR